MNGRFVDRVALVTGTGCVGPGWGNGRATAVRFAQEGARVFAVDRDPQRLEETVALAGASRDAIRSWQCDVTDGRAVAAMVGACMTAFGVSGDGRATASATLFLASDDARFITGAELVVDGGMTLRCD